MGPIKFSFKCLVISLFLIACGGGEEGEVDSQSTNTSSSSSSSRELFGMCGVVSNGSLQNGISSDEAEAVRVQVNNEADTVIVTRLSGEQAGNQQVIKLLGASDDALSAIASNRGVEQLRSLTRNGAFLVPAASSGCETSFPTGGAGVLGQLFTPSGQNVAEELISTGSLLPAADICSPAELVGCYDALPVQELVSSTRIRSFLWKPVSERDGNLVILVNPFNVDVLVNGELLTNFGASNGRGTTARANRSGAGFGSNITVEFFDSSGRRILLNDGRESVTIPSGGSRVEFNI